MDGHHHSICILNLKVKKHNPVVVVTVVLYGKNKYHVNPTQLHIIISTLHLLVFMDILSHDNHLGRFLDFNDA